MSKIKINRARSAFNFFKHDNKDDLKHLDTAAKKDLWTKLGSSHKHPYLLQAKKDKQRSIREKIVLQVLQELVAETAGEDDVVVASVLDDALANLKDETTVSQILHVFYAKYNPSKI